MILVILYYRQSFRGIKETMMTRPELEAFKRPVQDFNPKGFGYTEFALLEELIDQEFVQNNQLVIKVQAQPVWSNKIFNLFSLRETLDTF